MRSKNLLFTTALLAVALLASCSKDDSVSPLSKDDANKEMLGSTQNLQQEIVNLESLSSFWALNNLATLDASGILPSSLNTSSLKSALTQATSNLKTSANQALTFKSGTSYDFEAAKGEYRYLASKGAFYKVSSGGNAVILDFPSKANSTVNDCKLTLTAYSEQTIASVGTPIVTELAYTLQVDNIKTLGFSYKATLSDLVWKGYSSTGVAAYDFTLEVAPYVLKMSQNCNAAPTSFINTNTYSLKKDESQLFSFNCETTIRSTAADNSTFEGTSTFNYQVFSINMKGTFKFTNTTFSEENPDASSIISLTINKYPSGNLIGKLAFDKDADGEQIAQFEYADGTKVDFETLYSSLIGDSEGQDDEN